MCFQSKWKLARGIKSLEKPSDIADTNLRGKGKYLQRKRVSERESGSDSRYICLCMRTISIHHKSPEKEQLDILQSEMRYIVT